MFEAEISSMSPARFASVLIEDRFAAFERGIRERRELLDHLGVIRPVRERAGVGAAA